MHVEGDWQRDGILIVRGLFDPERVERLLTVSEQLLQQYHAKNPIDGRPGAAAGAREFLPTFGSCLAHGLLMFNTPLSSSDEPVSDPSPGFLLRTGRHARAGGPEGGNNPQSNFKWTLIVPQSSPILPNWPSVTLLRQILEAVADPKVLDLVRDTCNTADPLFSHTSIFFNPEAPRPEDSLGAGLVRSQAFSRKYRRFFGLFSLFLGSFWLQKLLENGAAGELGVLRGVASGRSVHPPG